MASVALRDMSGAQVGTLDLQDSVFAVEMNMPVVHQVVVAQQANRRQGTQSALTRSEVSGGGKKPWKQKGTGRARQGSTRSPQWRHGGVVFAPKPRSYRLAVNKKVRRLAMKCVLSDKLASGGIVAMQAISTNEAKTREIVAMLKALECGRKALIVMPEVNEGVWRAARNIPGVKTTMASTLSVLDILSADVLVATGDALRAIEEVYVG